MFCPAAHDNYFIFHNLCFGMKYAASAIKVYNLMQHGKKGHWIIV